MTKRVTRRKRPETTEQKYDRLNKRIVRHLPVTDAETAFVWREKWRQGATLTTSANHGVSAERSQIIYPYPDPPVA